MRHFFLSLSLVLGYISYTYAGPLDSQPAGQWLEVPNSHMELVAPNPLPPNSGGLVSIMTAWNSAAFDTRRERFIV